MTRPRLVSSKSIQKHLKKNKKTNNMELSANFTFFLLLFLMIGIAITYYKYMLKKLGLSN